MEHLLVETHMWEPFWDRFSDDIPPFVVTWYGYTNFSRTLFLLTGANDPLDQGTT